jgi:hypothetical protein
MIKSKKIREAARGQDCTFNIAYVCNYDPATTVLAHLPDESHGMGQKADDISAAFACSSCHNVVDNRVYDEHYSLSKQWYMRRAMVRTWRKLIEMGVIKIG